MLSVALPLAVLLATPVAIPGPSAEGSTPYEEAFLRGWTALAADRPAEAVGAFAAACEHAPRSPKTAVYLAGAHARAGDPTAALDALARAVELGWSDAPRLAADPDLASLRESAAFRALLARVERAPASTSAADARLVVPDELSSDNVESPDGDSVAALARDGSVRIWDLRTGETRVVLVGHGADRHGSLLHGLELDGVAFPPGGGCVVTWGRDGSARAWTLPAGAPRVLVEREGVELGGSLSPDGDRLLVWTRIGARDSGRSAPELILVETGRRTALEGEPGRIEEVAWSSDGAQVVLAGAERTFVHDGRTGELRGVIPIRGRSLAVSPEGTLLAIGDRRDDGWVSLVRLADGAVLQRFRDGVGVHTFVDDVAFDASGGRLLVAMDKVLYLRDLGAERRLWLTFFVGATLADLEARFVPSAELVVSGHRGQYTERLVSAATGEELLDLSELGLYGSMPTPDGRWILGRNAPLVLVDPLAREVRFRRTERPDGRSLRHLPTLHHEGDAAGVVVELGGARYDLARLAPELLDPKAVRAALARRPVGPPRLDAELLEAARLEPEERARPGPK